MFPLHGDIPYILDTGERTTLRDMLDGSDPEQVQEICEDTLLTVKGISDSAYYTPITSDITHYAIKNNTGALVSRANCDTMTFTVKPGEKYRITGTYRYDSSLYGLYANINAETGTTYPSDGHSYNTAVTETKVVTIPAGVTILRASTYISSLRVEKYIEGSIHVDHSDNVLYGKKWAACGDSYTCGNFDGYVDPEGHSGTESDAYDPIRKMYKTYPWFISGRNNMDLQMLAMGGNDFTKVTGATRAFSDTMTSTYNYTQITPDNDYVTLMFGLNETTLTAEQIGSAGDTTNATLWGAYDVVIKSIVTNNPFAKIGIIISDGGITEDYHDAVIAIAKYYEIPYLDMTNGVEVPAGIDGRYTTHSSAVQALRDAAYVVSNANHHPNVKAHEYRSTFIENFLRTL